MNFFSLIRFFRYFHSNTNMIINLWLIHWFKCSLGSFAFQFTIFANTPYTKYISECSPLQGIRNHQIISSIRDDSFLGDKLFGPGATDSPLRRFPQEISENYRRNFRLGGQKVMHKSGYRSRSHFGICVKHVRIIVIGKKLWNGNATLEGIRRFIGRVFSYKPCWILRYFMNLFSEGNS